MRKTYYQSRAPRLTIGAIITLVGLSPVVMPLLLNWGLRPWWESLLFFLPIGVDAGVLLWVLGVLASILFAFIVFVGVLYIKNSRGRIKLRFGDDFAEYLKPSAVRGREGADYGYSGQYARIAYRDIAEIAPGEELSRNRYTVCVRTDGGVAVTLPVAFDARERDEVVSFLRRKAETTKNR